MKPNHALRAAREATASVIAPGEPMSRTELAAAVNTWLHDHTGRRFTLTGHHIAKYERGAVRYPIAAYRAALRAVLGAATDAELGFVSPRTARHHTAPAAASRLDAASGEAVVDPLLHPSPGPPHPSVSIGRHLGPGPARPSSTAASSTAASSTTASSGPGWSTRQVNDLDELVAGMRRWRNSILTPDAVAAQLGGVLERLRATTDGPMTPRVLLAAGQLAKLHAAMSFDLGAHHQARRSYTLALRLADAGDADPFAASVLAALARQAFDLGNHQHGMHLIAAAEHRASRATRLHSIRATSARTSPGLIALLATRRAWGHALVGDLSAFQRAVERAEDAHARVDPSTEPSWLTGLDTAELAGVLGARYRDLARHRPDQAPRAVAYLEQALASRSPDRAYSHALDLVALARTTVLTGEPGRSCTLVTQALARYDSSRPCRLQRRLGDWSSEAGATYRGHRGVDELRDHLDNPMPSPRPAPAPTPRRT